MPEAELIQGEQGLKPRGEGWYVLNAKDAEWVESPHFGQFLSFEGDVPFDQLGVNIHVLRPGQPSCKYHRESSQEAFLVLSGECLLIVDGQERPLRAWDFFHCPPGVEHVFVGAGDGPCAILMMGSRLGEKQGLNYPMNETAARHGASVSETTPDPKVAYEGLRDRALIPAPFPAD